MIEFNCPKCRRPNRAPDDLAGTIIDCRSCDASIRVPDAAPAAELAEYEPPLPKAARPAPALHPDNAFAGIDDIDDEPEPEPEPKKPSRSAKKESSGTAVLFIGIAVGVLLIGGGVLAWQLLSNTVKPQSTEGEAKGGPAPQDSPPKQDGPLSPEEIYKRSVGSAALILAQGEDFNKFSAGSGSLIDRSRKLLLTAYHVVQGAQEIYVIFPKYTKDGKLITDFGEYGPRDKGTAKVWRSDPAKDLAILQLDWIPPESRAIPLAASSPEPGEETHTIGGKPAESLGLWIYSKGNVREVQKDDFVLDNKQRIEAWVIRTTNPVNKGDSGGGLINKKCELVGVCCAINRRAEGVMVFIDVREVRGLLGK